MTTKSLRSKSSFRSDKVKSNKPAASSIVRPLGYAERFFEGQIYNNLYCGTVVTCRYALPAEIADPSLQSEVRQRLLDAVARTVLDHPLMRVGIVGERDRKPSFCHLASIDLDHQVDWRIIGGTRDEYALAAEQMLDGLYDVRFTDTETRPGWKLVVMRPESGGFLDVNFVFRHSIGDGMSAKIMHQTLFEHLNRTAAGGSSSGSSGPVGLKGAMLVLEDRPSEIFTPALHDFAVMPVGFRYTVGQVWTELRPTFLVKPDYLQKKWGACKPGPAKTRRVSIVVEPAKANKILEVCRAHQTTFTGLLNGIMYTTFLPEAMAPDGRVAPIHATTALDLRRFITPSMVEASGVTFDPHRTFANMVSLVCHAFEAPKITGLAEKVAKAPGAQGLAHLQEIMWAVAKEARGDVQRRADKGLKDDLVGLMKLVTDWRKELSRTTRKPRQDAWQVTNLGTVDGGDAGAGWRMEQASFSLSCEVAGPVFVVCPMGIKGGGIIINVALEDSLGEKLEPLIKRMPAEMTGWLNYIATGTWDETPSRSQFL